uniref:Uncharacterized protein n=1 Tax=Macaca mulatta TaxID=9544 RepID=A0A5F8AI13_MACMU
MSFCMGVLFVDIDCYHFLFVAFPSSSQAPVLQVCWSLLEVRSRPCLPGYHLQKLQNSKDCCLVLPLKGSSQRVTRQMPVGALLYEVSVNPCWEASPHQEAWGIWGPLEEAVCPLTELKCCAWRSAALFRAGRQEHLSLLKLHPQPPLPPSALFQRDGSFICKPLSGAAAFLSAMPCPKRRNLERQSSYKGFEHCGGLRPV